MMMRRILKKAESFPFCGLLLLAEMLLWVYVNLRYQVVTDQDSAKVLYHTMQIWENRAIIIPNWQYMTTLEFDCTALFGLPIYILTGNILLSFAIANIINLVLFVSVILSLFKNLGFSFHAAAFAASLMLIPFAFGMVAYSNMLFYGSGQYIYKVLLPIWLLERMTAKKGNRILYVLAQLFFLFLCFLTGLSSGLYVLACGFLPILAVDGLIRLHADPDQRLRHILLPLCAVLVNLSGVVLQKTLGLSTYADQMTLVRLPDFFAQLQTNFTTLFQLIAALPEEEISLYSIGSILHIAKMIFLLLLFVFGLKPIRSLLASLDGEDILNSRRNAVPLMCSFIFLWNFTVLQLSVPTARYHLIGFVALILAAIFIVFRFMEKVPSKDQKLAFTILCCALLFLSGGSWGKALPTLGNQFSEYFKALDAIAEANGAKSIAYINESGLPEIARILIPDRDHVTYMTTNRSLVNYDTSVLLNDRSALDDRHLLVGGVMGDLESMPDYLKKDYHLVGDLFGDPVYLSETCHLDGMAGPLEGAKTIDFPYTPGYSFDADTDENGYWTSNEERRIVLESPQFISRKNPVTVTITYLADAAPEICGTLFLRNPEGIGDTPIEMHSDLGEVSFLVSTNTSFSFAIEIEPDSRLAVSNILFDATEK